MSTATTEAPETEAKVTEAPTVDWDEVEVDWDEVEFKRMDPKELIIGENVRLDPRLDEELIESVRARGVRAPVICWRDNDRVYVSEGQRRTLAAVEVKRPKVPVVIFPGRPSDIDRLIDQYNENKHRAALLMSEEVNVFSQLAAFGLPAEVIAKKISQPLPTIKNGIAVAKSKVATAATDKWDFLTIEDAAVLAEFDSDKEALAALVQAAKTGNLTYTAQRLRDQRAEAAAEVEAKAATIEELTAAGVTVIEKPDSFETIKRVRDLATDDGERMQDSAHTECPGHAAYLILEWIYPESSDDESSDDEEEEDDADPYRGWVPVYMCTDYAAHGHPPYQVPAAPVAAQPEPNAAEKEAARAQRREVIEGNKQWRSAETVRRTWLSTLLTRKTPPKAAAAFIAGSLARADHEITQALTSGNNLATELLGLTSTGKTGYGRNANSDAQLKHLNGASEARSQVITLALILAAYEERTGTHSWRNEDGATSRYLRYLQTLGYELTPVELRACGENVPLAEPIGTPLDADDEQDQADDGEPDTPNDEQDHGAGEEQ